MAQRKVSSTAGFRPGRVNTKTGSATRKSTSSTAGRKATSMSKKTGGKRTVRRSVRNVR